MPPHARPPRLPLRVARLSTLALVALAALVAPAGAQAAGSPAITLDAGVPSSVLSAKPYAITLTAADPAGQPPGYNLSFRDVLPAGVSYVAGSSLYGDQAIAPRILTDAPAVGQTTLIWDNVGDLSPASSGSLTYSVTYTTPPFDVGDTITHSPGAYVSLDPRVIPKFNANGTRQSADGYVETTKGAQLSAINITQSEPSPEGELLRGAHDHQTVYSFAVENNTVNSTSSVTTDVYLPANLEFLGCGGTDNTTDAPTNPGSSREYPGATALSGHTTAPAGCDTPTAVSTVSVDPDGGGPLPLAVYTKVSYALGTLAAGETRTVRYVAAVPIRANTLTFPGGTPSAAGRGQAANLNNNSGAESTDEQALPTYAAAAGRYKGVTDVSDNDTITRTAEDVQVLKGESTGVISQGQITRWTLTVNTSEYRYVDDISVTDAVPDGLCPLSSTALNGDADCANASGQAPSSPYKTAAENTDGSWALSWDKATDPALARLQPNASHVISFSTRTRTHYQENGADQAPVLARDSWANTVHVTGDDFIRCVGTADCTGASPVKIAGDETDGTPDVDDSSAGQSAPGPAIDKTVRTAGGAIPVDCSGGTYVDDTATAYSPGDRVCFKLRVDFNSDLDTGSPVVTDFLPAGLTYESSAATGANTATIKSTNTATAGVVAFTLGDNAGHEAVAKVFEVLLAARITDATKGANGDIKGNLMKFTHANTTGTSFPLRDLSTFAYAEPQLTLTESQQSLNGVGNFPAQPASGFVDTSTVQGSDVVKVRVDAKNSGGQDATATEVREKLPAGESCATVSAISDGGTCTANVITWTGVTVPAGGAKTLNFSYAVSGGVAPTTTFVNHAGVRSYQGADNTGGAFTYYPASNIDATVAAGLINAVAADDTTQTTTGSPTIASTRTTALTQTGNAASEATIGERIDYTATVTIPQGTTLSGATTVTIPLGAPQTLLGTPTYTLNGSPLPGTFTTDASGNTITVTFPAGYANASNSGNDLLVVTYAATVDDEAAVLRASTIPTTAKLTYVNGAGTTVNLTSGQTTTVVEPNLTTGSLVKSQSDPDGRVDAGELLTYSLKLTNTAGTRVSTANDVVLVDTLPVGVTPVAADGVTPVADGASVQPDAGTWDAGARTITFAVASITPGTQKVLQYQVRVDDPQTANGPLTNAVVATATSYLGTPGGAERTATTAQAQSIGGYRTTATTTVQLQNAGLAKTVSAPTGTIGDERDFTLDVTIPGGLSLFDVTALDTVPDGLTYEGLVSATCLSTCQGSPITVSELTSTANADGTTSLGFFLGDIPAVTGAANVRTVRIVYRASIDDAFAAGGKVLRGATLTNGATVYSNRTDKLPANQSTRPAAGSFDDTTGQRTATVTILEPTITLDKRVSGQVADSDTRTAQPGTSLTYTIDVKNTQNTTANDVVVTDQPDAELTNVVLAAGASTADSTDGWTAGDPDLAWSIPSIAAGATVTLSYTADLKASSSLHEADQAVNTAASTEYFAAPKATRDANPTLTYRRYTDVTPDVVTVDVDLPRLTITNTTGRPGFPESAHAEIGQPFPWRVVAGNASPTASAQGVDVAFRLPRNWSYDPGSAGAIGNPTITPDAVNGDLLTWTDVANLAPGATKVIAFTATPSLAAATAPGSGAGSPNLTSASLKGDDVTGATGSADGPYAAGPDPSQAILDVPNLTLAKTPDNGTVSAGATATWSVLVGNTGLGTARGVQVTDVIPAGVSYTAGTASSANGGFSELSRTVNPDQTTTVVWALSNLATGASATIAVPVAVAASDDAGTSYVNTASVGATEEPGGPSDTGSFTVQTRADLSVAKVAGTPSFTAGQGVSWDFTVHNAGPSDARAATLTDTLPAGVTFVGFDAGNSACSVAGQVVSCAFGTLAPGADRTLQVRGTLASNASGSVVNTASVATTTTDPVGADDTSTATTPVDESADLKVTKSVTPGTVVQGANATYTLKVDNLGPSYARTVVLTDPLPAGMTYVSNTGGCTASSGSLTCPLGTLANGASTTFDVVAQVVGTGTKVNTATVTTSGNDPVAANDTDSASIAVTPAVDLALDKTGPATVAAGADATFSLQLTNLGPSASAGSTVTDTLPTGLTFKSSPDCTQAVAGGPLTCPVGALAVTASKTLTVVATADYAAAGSSLTNSASVVDGGGEAEPVTSNNADTATVAVGPASDLAVTKTVSPGTVAQDQNAAYTLKVTDNGLSTATGITLSDPLPAGVTFVSLAAPAGASCTTPAVGSGGTVSCTLADLAKDASATLTLTIRGKDVGTHTNTVTVAGSNPDGVPANNTASADLVVGPTGDMSIVKTGPATAVAGGQATYSLVATNSGPSTATAVTVTDTLPAGLTAVGATSTQGTCSTTGQTVSCAVGTLVKNATATVTVVTDVAYSAAAQTLTNTAAVDAAEADNDPSDDTSSAQTTVGPAADLRIEKTVTPAVVLAQNRLATYTIKVTDDGPSTAQAPVITDALPAGVAFVSSTGPCTEVSGTVTCTLPDLASGASATVTVTVRGLANGISTNTASVASPTPDPSMLDNTASVDLSVGPTADLSITKTAPATAVAGGQLTYALAVANAGPSPATGVTVTDVLPAGLTAVSATPSQGTCTVTGQTVSCALGGLPVTGTATVALKVAVGFAVAGQDVVNTASVKGAENDNDSSDDQASAAVTVGPAADLEVVKSAPAQVPAGGRLLYSITVTNRGPQTATGVTLADVLPAGLTFFSAQPSQGSCASTGAKVDCALGSIPPGGGAQVLVAADVASSLEGSRVVNVATVAGDQPDPSAANNSDDAATDVVLPAPSGSLTVEKVADSATTALGGRIGFTITVRNASTRPATGVVAIDKPSLDANVDSAKPSQGTCKALRCDLGTLARGQVVTIRVVMTPRQAGKLANSVTVTSNAGEVAPADNQDVAGVVVSAAPTTFSLVKRLKQGRVKAGASADFTITGVNTGKAAAANVRVCDLGGSHLAFVTARGAHFSAGHACWTIAYWKAHERRSFTVRMRVARDTTAATVNRAQLTAGSTRTMRAQARVRVSAARAAHAGGVTG